MTARSTQYDPDQAAKDLIEVALEHASSDWRGREGRDAVGVASAFDRLEESASDNGARELLDLIAGARLCSERLRTIELAAARAARRHGVSIRQLAQAAVIAERSAAERYGRPKLLISDEPRGDITGSGIYAPESDLTAVMDLLTHHSIDHTPVATEDHGRPGEGQIYALALDAGEDADAVAELLGDHFYDVEREARHDDD